MKTMRARNQRRISDKDGKDDKGDKEKVRIGEQIREYISSRYGKRDGKGRMASKSERKTYTLAYIDNVIILAEEKQEMNSLN